MTRRSFPTVVFKVLRTTQCDTRLSQDVSGGYYPPLHAQDDTIDNGTTHGSFPTGFLQFCANNGKRHLLPKSSFASKSAAARLSSFNADITLTVFSQSLISLHFFQHAGYNLCRHGRPASVFDNFPPFCRGNCVRQRAFINSFMHGKTSPL